MPLYRWILILSAILLISTSIYTWIYRPGGEVVVVTTTSLYATGFLDMVRQGFEEGSPGITVKIVSLGSGAALEAASRGDGDIVFAHAPSLEKKYIEAGVLERGVIIMYNYFVIVGPPHDPANVSGASDPVEAFRRIYIAGEAGEAVFISRGDNSGTHVKELQLWRLAGIEPGGDWYIESGSGMGQTLLIANEMDGYTLSDIGTYVIYRSQGRISLEKLYEGGDELINIYSIYLVKGADEEAERFYSYVVSNIDSLIERFNRERGMKIFYRVSEYGGDITDTWRYLAGDAG